MGSRGWQRQASCRSEAGEEVIFLALRRYGLAVALALLAIDVLIGARLLAWEIEILKEMMK